MDMVARSQKGFYDWVIQRVSAKLIFIYALVVLIYVCCGDFSFSTWQHLMHNNWMRCFTLLVTLSIVWHAWIGLWTVLTDYVHHRALRTFLLIDIGIVLFGYVFWVCVSIF